MDASTDRLKNALTRAADGAFVVTADGHIVLWNAAATSLLGHADHEVIGRPCREVFRGRDDCGNLLCLPGCRVTALLNLGDPVCSFDMQTECRDGRPIWLNVSVLPLCDADGTSSFTAHLLRDITEMKETLDTPGAHPGASEGGLPAAGLSLTMRQMQILRAMATGATTTAAAERLGVSRATLRNHLAAIFQKLGVHSRLQAVAIARRTGLV